MNFAQKIVFITGSNRGIGKALVEACLNKGVKKVYASARNIQKLPDFGDSRVVPVELDITNKEHINKAASLCADTQILINNAGSLHAGSVLDGDFEGFRKDMEINCFATMEVLKAFVPALEKNPDPRVVNIASIASYVNFPFIAGYSASKAALYSMSQAARIELSRKNIPVHIINPGAIDTDMNKGSTMDMTSAEDVAMCILSELELEVPDIIPDKIGRSMMEVWRRSPAALEALASKMYFGDIQ